jgi:Uma2 family endonuclease
MSSEHETDPTEGVPMTSATVEAPPDTECDMAAAYSVLFRAMMRRGSGEWTVADLNALGLDEHVRVEIDEGNLFVSPSPTSEHQGVEFQLEAALRASLGKRHKIRHFVDLYINERRYFEPDVVVCRQDWRPPKAGYRIRSADVALVVEVESPGTATFDKVNKSRAYAQAGIPAYWRVRLEPRLTVLEYRLPEDDATEYALVAEHVGVLRTEFPGAVEIDLRAIEEEVFGDWEKR